jgi:hypothetical protein
MVSKHPVQKSRLSNNRRIPDILMAYAVRKMLAKGWRVLRLRPGRILKLRRSRGSPLARQGAIKKTAQHFC